MTRKPRIAIIGAGIAGIYAARTLHHNGFDDIIIFEASNRIGGRIWSMKHGDDYVELGAQWIHGQDDNILYEYASSRDLISDPEHDYGIEGNGYYCNENGETIECPLAKKLINYLDETKNRMNNDAIENDRNVFDYFVHQFNQFVRSSLNGDHDVILDERTIEILKQTFRWFIIYEVIDNSCENLQTLSTLSYTEWEDCKGVADLIHFQRNYSSIFEELEKDFPIEKYLWLQTQVKKIELINNDSGTQQVKLHYVFFHFPEEKRQIIQAIGFGTINKVFLEFDIPFWNDQVKGFQIVWTNVHDDHSFPDIRNNNHVNFCEMEKNFPEWVYCIQGFDLVRNQPKMLMAWIGSYGAKQMEQYSNEEIGKILTKVLQQIVPKQCRTISIDYPTNIFCSRWYSDPFIRGSYSNRTIMYEKINNNDDGYNIDILVKPIYDENGNKKPLILFAGEATDRKHYSTTHGAMRSGEREAFRLISFFL
ncbi:peroxisomal n-acetyl-spermine/spermidine oxidase-like protein [Dermatophagoides farinae]|uniref:Peroxisomal n-acetyl-spermine/spermidine oxidase-like protein n=1 Tax=Dermatophagoides farinae TaxID=6954 RepID=A0A9D4P1E4_DERFA|nr:peroxisomal n-acetyl-spermine/spermidine oxidase-like protein [Dermatophagoides farinae]